MALLLSQCLPQGQARTAGYAERLRHWGHLAEPPLTQRVDHQDALLGGQATTEFAPAGKAAVEIRTLFRASNVTEALDILVRLRGRSRSLPVDNRPEFAGRMLDRWAYLNGVAIDFSRPGNPTSNAYIEAFNGRPRAECLNASWFLSLADARERIEDWRCHYNDDRPHTALDGLTPRAFVNQAVAARETGTS